jgi:hypothetical protein
LPSSPRDLARLEDASLETTRELRLLQLCAKKNVDRDEVEALVEGFLRRRR